MRKKALFSVLVFCAAGLSAQYRIDLSDIVPSPIRFLEMGNPGPAGKEIRINSLYWEECGKPELPVMGEFHYNRMDERYWRENLMKMKASGVDIVSTYTLWVLHEEFEGRQNWEGRNNLRKFVQLCHELGLKVHLRIGPYCNAEIRNGGFPDWMEKNASFRTRTNDPVYLEYVRYWYRSLFQQVKGLLYKDGGPVVAVQLENEYVTEGMVVPHIMALKKIAIEEGFDVPVYSMTHWMMSDYPKGEVIPYAGYYLETPWISYGDKENPTTEQEFFSYNRISDNIGNDFIKTTGKVETLDGSGSDAPYFTCEVGVGTPNYYMRRAVVPEELAGETINLRLGCGVNLMGYYVYVGQTDPIGEQYTTARQTARVSNDYQAPIREFGSMGASMIETKKLNYFMNDFGEQLVKMKSYLPTTNKDRDNLQWAVRTDGKSGFVFCSNYLYKHSRKDYEDVQFKVRLKGEEVALPRTPMTIGNGSYFFWPFNLELGGATLNYATAQPVCRMLDGDVETFFFFEDDNIPAEFLWSTDEVSEIKISTGKVHKVKKGFRIDGLKAGKDCVMEVVKKDGESIRVVVLTEKESDLIWKGKVNGKDFVSLSSSMWMTDGKNSYFCSEESEQIVWSFDNGRFVSQTFTSEPVHYKADVKEVAPLDGAKCISPQSGKKVQRNFDATSLSKIERAYLRYMSDSECQVKLNETFVQTTTMDGYRYAEITDRIKLGQNNFSINMTRPEKGVTAQIEVLLEDGTRWLWNTDHLWKSEDLKVSVSEKEPASRPGKYDDREHLSVFQIRLPQGLNPVLSTRLYIRTTGDVGNAYIGDRLIHDHFINGSDWIIGLNRYTDLIDANPVITIRVDGLKSADIPMYLEKNITREECVLPVMKSVEIRQEYCVQYK